MFAVTPVVFDVDPVAVELEEDGEDEDDVLLLLLVVSELLTCGADSEEQPATRTATERATHIEVGPTARLCLLDNNARPSSD